MTSISTPAKGYTGTSTIGAVTLLFEDGTAEYDGDLPDGVRAYLEASGFGINGPASTPVGIPGPADPRTGGTVQVGSKLRDAAVDPKPSDFLPPTNAGEANPHGPDVVSPGIHALQDVRPVTPGPVAVDEPEKQENKETEHAANVAATGTVLDKPAGNASRDDWHAYATSRDIDAGSLEELSRDEIRDTITNLDK